MKIIAIDTNGSQISINQFFSSFEEFSNNQHLLEQTSRFLKAIIRHPTPDDIKYIAVETKQGYVFSVDGRERTYSITFEILDNFLILTTIN